MTRPSVRSGIYRKPFDEQVAYFRSKLGNKVPTSRWDDIRREAHDKAFMVAGAAKADLLSDLAASVDRAVSEGATLQGFRKDFRGIVERRGWHGWTGEGSAAGQAWRTRTIYKTNMAMAHSAGRVAQLNEGGFDYWVYRHSGNETNPRLQHLAWDGLTLPKDDPFWEQHTPINSFGCECYVLGARSKKAAQRLGGSPDKQRPANWNEVDPKTGAPVGVGEGFDYKPGGGVSDTVRAMARKTHEWDYAVAKTYMQGLPSSVADQLARSYRELPSVANDARLYGRRVLSGRDPEGVPPYRTLGLLTRADSGQVKRLKDLDVSGYDFALDAGAIKAIQGRQVAGRAVRDRDYAVLPRLLNEGGDWSDAGVSRSGQPLIKRRLTRNGEAFEAVFEVRSDRKMLVLDAFHVREG